MGLGHGIAHLDGRAQEVGIGDGLEQVVGSVDLITVHGIFAEGRGEHDARRRAQHTGEVKAVEARHLDVQEKQIDGRGLQGVEGFDGTVVTAAVFEKGRLGHITLKKADGQRLVVDDGTGHGDRGRLGSGGIGECRGERQPRPFRVMAER